MYGCINNWWKIDVLIRQRITCFARCDNGFFFFHFRLTITIQNEQIYPICTFFFYRINFQHRMYANISGVNWTWAIERMKSMRIPQMPRHSQHFSSSLIYISGSGCLSSGRMHSISWSPPTICAHTWAHRRVRLQRKIKCDAMQIGSNFSLLLFWFALAHFIHSVTTARIKNETNEEYWWHQFWCVGHGARTWNSQLENGFLSLLLFTACHWVFLSFFFSFLIRQIDGGTTNSSQSFDGNIFQFNVCHFVATIYTSWHRMNGQMLERNEQP